MRRNGSGAAIVAAFSTFVLSTVMCTAATAAVRTYYISADEVNWDYVPSGTSGPAGKPHAIIGYFAEPKGGDPVTRPVSTIYRKCLYREYTDGTFRELKARPPRWQHLGFLGPLIRAEVGDSIKIIYRNTCNFPNSIHVHGLLYTKSSEGAPYNDGTRGGVKPGDAVAPGTTYTYRYEVPERAGPGPMDPNSILWMYHSHTKEEQDVDTGLMGPIIITARDQSKPDGTPKSVDREFVIWFSQTDESQSWYVKQNIPTLATDHAVARPSDQLYYPYFVTFSLNGYTYNSMPPEYLTMRKGGHVRWYLMAGQNDFDFHAPYWDGNTV